MGENKGTYVRSTSVEHTYVRMYMRTYSVRTYVHTYVRTMCCTCFPFAVGLSSLAAAFQRTYVRTNVRTYVQRTHKPTYWGRSSWSQPTAEGVPKPHEYVHSWVLGTPSAVGLLQLERPP